MWTISRLGYLIQTPLKKDPIATQSWGFPTIHAFEQMHKNP